MMVTTQKSESSSKKLTKKKKNNELSLQQFVNEMIQNPFDAQVTLQFALNSYKDAIEKQRNA